MFTKISLIYNVVQLLGWSTILGLVLLETFNGTKQTGQIVCLVKTMQVSQIFDLISNILGLTSGSLISNILQLGGRNLVALVFMYDGVDFASLGNALVAWSLAEIIRFSYYLCKDVSIFRVLRYNAFMFLYPVGILGELRLVNKYLETAGEGLYTPLRGLQGVLIFGGVFLYMQMMGAKLKQQRRTTKPEASQSSPVSKAKRE